MASLLPTAFDSLCLIHMTGRANWGISHVVGQGGGWEGRSWMQEVEDELFQIYPSFGLSSGRKTNCLLDITKPKEFYQIGRKDVGWQSVRLQTRMSTMWNAPSGEQSWRDITLRRPGARVELQWRWFISSFSGKLMEMDLKSVCCSVKC